MFAAVIKGQFYILAIVGILNSVVSLYYYLKPIRMMFFEQPQRRRGYGAVRGVELRADGSAGLRDDRVWAVLVADYFVRESVDQFLYWGGLKKRIAYEDPHPPLRGDLSLIGRGYYSKTIVRL